jgi:hypothetical protein
MTEEMAELIDQEFKDIKKKLSFKEQESEINISFNSPKR